MTVKLEIALEELKDAVLADCYPYPGGAVTAAVREREILKAARRVVKCLN